MLQYALNCFLSRSRKKNIMIIISSFFHSRKLYIFYIKNGNTLKPIVFAYFLWRILNTYGPQIVSGGTYYNKYWIKKIISLKNPEWKRRNLNVKINFNRGKIAEIPNKDTLKQIYASILYWCNIYCLIVMIIRRLLIDDY